MSDIVDTRTRARMMASIKGKDTRPELVIRSALHNAGFRYRLHDPRLPGKPDLVLPRYRSVIFVHGCFWHRHRGCKYRATPSTRMSFWEEKFEKNIARDQRNCKLLNEAGWNVLIVWECGVQYELDRVMECIQGALISGFRSEVFEIPEKPVYPALPDHQSGKH